MEPFYSFEYAGCTIELHQDEEPMSPAEWDNLGTLYALTRDADYVGFESPSETHGRAIEASERGGAILVRYLRLCHGVIALPLFVADRGSSGVTIYESDEPNAYIATTPERVRELCGNAYAEHGEAAHGVVAGSLTTREWQEEALRGELQTWSDFLAGEVYGYVVRRDGAVVDSCWSIYPDHEPIAPSEKATASYHVAWEELPDYLRGFANAVAEAIDEAEYEQAERERAAAKYAETARCRYSDCREGHAVADEGEQVTCHSCREWLGLPQLEDASVATRVNDHATQ